MRPQQAALRMVPAHECFRADDRPARQVDRRLEVEHERIRFDRLCQLGSELVAPDDLAVHRCDVRFDPVLAVRLGLVHRDVRVAHQVGR